MQLNSHLEIHKATEITRHMNPDLQQVGINNLTALENKTAQHTKQSFYLSQTTRSILNVVSFLHLNSPAWVSYFQMSLPSHLSAVLFLKMSLK